MTKNYYVVTGCLEAKEGQEEILVNELRSLIQASSNGCIQYSFHRAVNNSKQFMFYEVWRNQDAFKAHCVSPHIMEWEKKKDQLLAKPNDVLFWEFEI